MLLRLSLLLMLLMLVPACAPSRNISLKAMCEAYDPPRLETETIDRMTDADVLKWDFYTRKWEATCQSSQIKVKIGF